MNHRKGTFTKILRLIWAVQLRNPEELMIVAAEEDTDIDDGTISDLDENNINSSNMNVI
jgi:hypothetical protein